MGKRLFLLLLAGVMGAISTSTTLTAADDFVAKEPEFHAVETVPLPEPEPEPAPVVYAAKAATLASPAAPQVVNYTVTVYTGTMIDKGLSYGDIYKFRNLIYGHNSSNLLGNLKSLSEGQVFTITENGAEQNYRVAAKVTYEKTADGFLNNDPYLMGEIANKAGGHSVALMTCAGKPDGQGGASHRLVIYADRV